MIWAVVGIAALALAMTGVAMGVVLKYVPQSRDDRVATVKATSQFERVTEMHGKAVRDLAAEAAAHVDTRVRLERVVAQQKAEIARLEGELDAELDPTSVRERLAGSGLLGGSPAGTVAADRPSAAASLPPRASTDVGAGGRPAGR